MNELGKLKKQQADEMEVLRGLYWRDLIGPALHEDNIDAIDRVDMDSLAGRGYINKDDDDNWVITPKGRALVEDESASRYEPDGLEEGW